jgi:hypothetical protein
VNGHAASFGWGIMSNVHDLDIFQINFFDECNLRCFGVCQQIHCLTLSQLLSVGVLLYTVAILMGLSVELVFVVDDVISVVLPTGI